MDDSRKTGEGHSERKDVKKCRLQYVPVVSASNAAATILVWVPSQSDASPEHAAVCKKPLDPLDLQTL